MIAIGVSVELIFSFMISEVVCSPVPGLLLLICSASSAVTPSAIRTVGGDNSSTFDLTSRLSLASAIDLDPSVSKSEPTPSRRSLTACASSAVIPSIITGITICEGVGFILGSFTLSFLVADASSAVMPSLMVGKGSFVVLASDLVVSAVFFWRLLLGVAFFVDSTGLLIPAIPPNF